MGSSRQLIFDFIGPTCIAGFGLLCIFCPRLMTKAQGEQFEVARKKLRTAGYLLLAGGCMAALGKVVF